MAIIVAKCKPKLCTNVAMTRRQRSTTTDTHLCTFLLHFLFLCLKFIYHYHHYNYFYYCCCDYGVSTDYFTVHIFIMKLCCLSDSEMSNVGVVFAINKLPV